MSRLYDREELYSILDICCHGALSGEQSRQLARILRESSQARRDYLEYMDVHAALQWEIGGRAEITEISRHFREELRSEVAPRSRTGGRRQSSWRGFFRIAVRRAKNKVGEFRFNLALACIASLLFAGAIAGTGAIISAIFMQHSPAVEQPPTELFAGAKLPAASGRMAGGDGTDAAAGPSVPVPAPVARLGREIDCVWSTFPRPSREGTGVRAVAPTPGERFLAGRELVLKSGLAEIIFESGAEMILEGPATLEICSSASIALDRGKCAVTAEKPSARGFTIHAPGMLYTDLGTEFGVLVAPAGQQEVHVFRGRVQAEQGAESKETGGRGLPSSSGRAADGERGSGSTLPTPHTKPLLLSALEGLRVAAPNAAGAPAKPIERIVADEKQFVRTEQIAEIAAQAPEFRRWKRFRDDLCKRSDLVAYYDFQPDESDSSVLRNRAASGDNLDGRIEGAKWADGPCRGKLALVFSGRNDRVRVDIPGSFEACTMAAWINVTDLHRPLNAIAMSDGLHNGFYQGNWQFWPDGSASFGPCWAKLSGQFPPGYNPEKSNVVIGQDDFGTWCHLAAVYDLRAGTVAHYKNGRESGGRGIGSGTPFVFGPSQIANSRLPAGNLRARIGELCFFSRALPAKEIKRLYEQTVAEPDEP